MSGAGTCTVSATISDVGALTTATVYLYVNDTQKQSKTADDETTVSFSSLTVAAGDKIQIKAKSDNNEVAISRITMSGSITPQLFVVAS